MSADMTPGGTVMTELNSTQPIPPITAHEAATVRAQVHRHAAGDAAVEAELIAALGIGGAR